MKTLDLETTFEPIHRHRRHLARQDDYLRESPVPRRKVSHCHLTGKVRFGTHEAALQRAGEILASGARRCTQFRAYLCDHCAGYHLTSKPLITHTS